MSWSERNVQHHRRCVDRAIHQAFQRLQSDSSALQHFKLLVSHVRRCAPHVLSGHINGKQHPGVDALVHMALHWGAHIRPIAAWQGTTSTWRKAIRQFAAHLFCRYQVPAFLASCWHANDEAGDRKRQWFLAHGRGSSVRSLQLPIAMNRRMEHLVVASQDHVSIEHALRMAELRALGASKEIVRAVMCTRMATDFSNAEFWRTVWLFFVAYADELVTAQIGPIIDFLQSIRHTGSVAVIGGETVQLTPPQPDFALKGRTPQSLMKLVRAWHKTVGANGPLVSWAPSPFRPLCIEESASDEEGTTLRWQIIELTDSAQLRSEGAAMHHCVASYADQCRRSISSIWSLRLWRGTRMRSMLTVEVSPQTRRIVQAR